MSIGISKKVIEPKPATVTTTKNQQQQQQQKPIFVTNTKPVQEAPKLEPMPSTSSNTLPPQEILKTKENAKNIEIRRMSATDDGDKVLESAWDSPEKDTKTPLQMVQSIVSQIEDIKPPPKTEESSQPPRNIKVESLATSQPAPPAWVVQGNQRPLLHSQKQVANETPPSSKPLPNLIPPQHRTPAISTVSQNVTTIMAPAPQFVPVTAAGQQVMQLVNTINGPMLMQAIPTPVQTTPIAAPPASGGKGPKKNSPEQQQQPQHIGSAPTPIQYQTQVVPAAAGGGPVPILVSPNTMMATGQQTSPTGIPQAQHVLIGHPAAGVGMIQAAGAPQFLLNQPTMIAPNQVFLSSNGTLVAMPTAAPQGVIYNQLPDGTLVQVQSPMIHQAPQTILQTNNGPVVINNGAATQQVSPNGAGQIQTVMTAPTPGGTYIMTPSGLVQTSPVPAVTTPTSTMTSVSQSNVSNNMTELLEPQPGPSSVSMNLRKESTDEKTEESDDNDSEEEDDDDSDNDEHVSMADVQLVLQMDEDSSEDEIPLASKKKVSPTSSTGYTKSKGLKNKNSSPKTYIQSNKVDSSGLQATPPHPADESESSLNKLSSPERVITSTKDDVLDTSGSTDASSSSRSPTKRRRKRNAEELLKDEIGNALDSDGKLTGVWKKLFKTLYLVLFIYKSHFLLSKKS